jgi:organic hydroperoxide reductase OsmC/OhrA
MDATHSYTVKALSTTVRSGVGIRQDSGPSIAFSAPPEFGGIAGMWTPEHLFVMAVASCYVSTFSGIAEISHFNFVTLDLDAEGFLQKLDHGWKFSNVILRPVVRIASEKDRDRALRIMEKAEKGCLVARSLNCPVTLEPQITVEEELMVMANK